MKNIQDWLAIPIEEFQPKPAMIYIVLVDSRMQMMAQYINPHWESIPNRNKITKGLTHVFIKKDEYINSVVKSRIDKIPTLLVSQEVYDAYNSMADVHIYDKETIYEINSVLFKLKLKGNGHSEETTQKV